MRSGTFFKVVSLAEASLDLLDRIVFVANSAYRCLPKFAKSWTNEGHLIEGDRLNIDQLRADLANESIRLIGAFGDDGLLVGSIEVTMVAPKRVSFGLFNVDPNFQSQNIGKGLLEEAEKVAKKDFDAEIIEMCVLAKRTEIIKFYERRGFSVVEGKLEKFPIGKGKERTTLFDPRD